MTRSTTADIKPVQAPAGGGRWMGLLLVVATVAAYHNSFSGPFVFDDGEAIMNNPSIRNLSAMSEVLFGGQAAGMTGNGRPVFNLTLAANFAASGTAVRGYHLVNLLIHLGAGLVLFGLIRRTLGLDRLAGRWAEHATSLAGLTALLWLVHPLQTEAVTYVVQRAESLTGLFYLLTLYLFVRGTGAPRPAGWLLASAGACLLGMGTKEVMVSAPVLVLLYDRTFVAGTFRGAWRARRSYYVGLAATWLVLGWLVARTGGRGDSAGFDTAVAVWPYLLTQCAAILHYLRLTVWPHPLVLDYGNTVVTHLADVWEQAVALVGGAVATLWALRRRPAGGFVGAWFFCLLAPSSSFVPIATQTMAEHRMYLALAAPVLLAVVGLQAALGRRTWWVGGPVALALIVVTVRRNEDYASRLAIWADTVAHRPENPRAHNNLAIELSVAGRGDEAVAHLQRALALRPNYGDARNNLANEYLKQGRVPEAITSYELALRTGKVDLLALSNLGVALLQAGRLAEAMTRYEQLLGIDPANASAEGNLGYILLQDDRPAEALAHYERAAQLAPGEARPQFNLAVALFRNGRLHDALGRCEASLRLDPANAEARQLAAQLRSTLPGAENPGR